MKQRSHFWLGVGLAASVLLQPHTPAFAQSALRITEFMAANFRTLADEEGNFPDWIEIHNPGNTTVNLDGWFLTDRASQLNQWRFPATNLPPNGYLVVFASGHDRRVPGAPLHTNFRLANNGEYLALVAPDGTNVVSAFAPAFPPQVAGVSYGIPLQQTVTPLIAQGAPARVFFPANGDLGAGWTGLFFDDSAWTGVLTGLGYERDERVPFVPVTLADSAAEFSGTQGQNQWHYGYWDRDADADGVYAASEFVPFPNSGGAYGATNYWTGSLWDWFGGNPPFTELTRDGGRPSGDQGNPALPKHWAVRRYICETNGPIAITGTLQHTSDWVRVTATGTAGSSLMYIYLTGVGDGYIDDLVLVAGTTPEVGTNLLANGNFESGALAPWTVSPNLTNSVISTGVRHSGNRSLHIVATAGGSTQGDSIWQTVSPTLTSGQTYTLSYWYLPSPNSAPLIVRFSGGWIATQPAYCGDGTVGRILVDGVPVYERSVFVQRDDFRVNFEGRVGAKVDFVLDPGPAGNDACDHTIFTANLWTADPTVARVADSVADWSFNGVQGEKNWYYGYFNNGTNIPPLPYAPANFTPFPRQGGAHGPNNFWDGASWDWWNGDPPLDEIGQVVMIPNGFNNTNIHWVIRRWVSEVTGSITVDWTLLKPIGSGAGVSARVLHNGIVRDGLTLPGTNPAPVVRSLVISNVAVGDSIDFVVDPQGLGGGYGDGGDRLLLTAVIYGQPSLTRYITSDLETPMWNMSSSAYVRIPFTVADPSAIQYLTLRMKYDDGFVAYLNGVQVASANAPGEPAWNSTALRPRSDAEAGESQEFNLTSLRGLLQPGANVLAIHGLNVGASDSDFLLLPELDATSIALEPSLRRYFTVPTPGAVNGYGQTNLGPLITSAKHAPNIPRDDEDLLVTAEVLPTFRPISAVSLKYRVMFSNNVATVPMFDDGQHGDGAAADGVFGGTIPASASGPGQMLRYYIHAEDGQGGVSRFPAFEDPKNSPEYQGTVIPNPSLTNPLPVLHLFVQDPVQATNYTGTRASLFYDEEFYDNVGVNLHGQTTASVFPKRSFDVDMNPGIGFRWRRGEALLDDFDLMTTSPDKAHLRHVLAYETFATSGVPCHVAIPVRVQQNGALYGIMHLLDNGDDRMIRRLGFDPEGALYKIYLPLTNAYGGVAEKKTRQNENNADLQALIDGLQLNGTALRQYLYDHVDVAEVVNMLAAIQLVQNEDCCWFKNYYLYRDSNGTGDWQMWPWDLDLTFGRTFTGWLGEAPNRYGGYYDTNIYWTNRWYTQSRANFNFIGLNQPLADAVFGQPDTFAMFLRRWTTLHEEFLQNTNTHPMLLHFERRVDELAAAIGPDATLDTVLWGPMNPIAFFPTQSLAEAVAIMKTQYFAPRRRWVFNTLRYSAGGPYLGPQPSNAVIRFGAIDFNPASGNQAQEYIQLINTNSFAVDISGWRLAGAIDFAFRGGTVLAPSNSLYVSPDLKAFRARAVSPRGGEGLFAQGNYHGQLSARGEMLQLLDRAGAVVSATNYTGNPSLAQQYLRITEIMYNPEASAGQGTGPDDLEFIELKNTGPMMLSLVGARFVNGIEFAFTASGPVTNLASGESVLVVRNVAAFTARYGTGLNIAGQFTGALDNAGENLRLEDAAGEKILDFDYDNAWLPLSDGFGFSLVIADDTAPWDTWNEPARWRLSSAVGGSPGQANPAPAVLPPVLVNEVLAHSPIGVLDAVELFNPAGSNAHVGGWFISDDFRNPKKFRIPDGTTIGAGSYYSTDESEFNPPPPAPPGFSFSGEGDEVYLFSADAAGQLTGYHHGFAFGASESHVSLGRHVTSTGEEHLVAQRALSFLAPNAGPKVGPVVIAEIMYHPVDLPGGADNQDDEFIELRNITGQAVDLFNPALAIPSWRIRGGVQFDFPPNVTLPAGGTLLLVRFNPTNTDQLAAFRARFAVPPYVPVFGPYAGKLDNSSDRIELQMPDQPDPGEPVPFVVLDVVSYRDDLPWPDGADGWGASLHRNDPVQYGDDPIHWTAGTPSPGGAFSGDTPPRILEHPASQVAWGRGTTLSVVAEGAAPLRYQWRVNGTLLPGATNALLELENLPAFGQFQYSVAVFNPAGSTISSNATLTLLAPILITSQPQHSNTRLGSNATFSVVAFSVRPIQYQWYYNGQPIPNATNASHTVTNVQLADNGDYSVRLSDSGGSIASTEARLTVLIRPAIHQQPIAAVALEGGTATFTAEVSGTPPPSFRWRRNAVTFTNGIIISTPTFASLTVTNLQLNDNNRTFQVIVTNLAGSVNSATVLLTVLADTDRDGLPDSWETNAVGFDPNSPLDGARDDDGDGLTNGQEWFAGTDYLDPASCLRIGFADAAGALLTFPAVSNRSYSVQFTDQLGSGRWQALGDEVARTNSRTVVVPDVGARTNRVYRAITPISR